MFRSCLISFLWFSVANGLRACENRLKSVKSGIDGLKTASYMPNCTINGDYELKQCDEKGCWCVDPESGERAIAFALEDPVNCYPCHLKKSQLLRLEVHTLPKCTEAGFFEPKQCSDGLCWCANKDTGNKYGLSVDVSVEIACDTVHIQKLVDSNDSVTDILKYTPPTLRHIGNNSKLCGAHLTNGSDAKNLISNLSCSENGYYKVKQCNNATGSCWCVHPISGEAVSKRSPSQKLVCKACHIEMETALSENKTFEKICTNNGGFNSTQCDNTGCWCVTEDSGELYGQKLNSSAFFECATDNIQHITFPDILEHQEAQKCPEGSPLQEGHGLVMCHADDDKCPPTHFCSGNTNDSYCCPTQSLSQDWDKYARANCSRRLVRKFSGCLHNNSSSTLESVTTINSLLSGASRNASQSDEALETVRDSLNRTCAVFHDFLSCAKGLDTNDCGLLKNNLVSIESLSGVLCTTGSLDHLRAGAKCFATAAKTESGKKCIATEVETSAQACDVATDPTFMCLLKVAKDTCGNSVAENYATTIAKLSAGHHQCGV